MKNFIIKISLSFKRFKLLYILSMCQISLIVILTLLFSLPIAHDLVVQIFISITTGYTLTFIFYVIQVHIPKLHSEKIAYEILRPDLEYLYETLIEKISIFNKFVSISEDERLLFPVEEVYFKYLYKGRQRNKNIVISDFLAKSKIEIDNAVDKIITLPVFNFASFDLIHSLSLLKLNNFWGSFKDFDRLDTSFIFIANFISLTSFFNEFKCIIQQIEKYVNNIPDFDIIMMTESEKQSHLETVNNFNSNRVVLRSLVNPHETVVKINKSNKDN